MPAMPEPCGEDVKMLAVPEKAQGNRIGIRGAFSETLHEDMGLKISFLRRIGHSFPPKGIRLSHA